MMKNVLVSLDKLNMAYNPYLLGKEGLGKEG